MAPLASHAFVHQQQLSCPSIDTILFLHDEKLEIAKVVVHAAEEAVQAQHRQVLLFQAARESQPSVTMPYTQRSRADAGIFCGSNFFVLSRTLNSKRQ
jgi:hypothetical protein